MEQIKAILKANRPNISESSIKTYTSLLNAIYRNSFPDDKEMDIEKFKDVDKVMEFANTKAASTRRSYLAALVVLLNNGEETEIYRKQMLKDIKTHQEEEDEQRKTRRQEENWIDYEDVKKIWNDMYNELKPILKKKTPIEINAEKRRKLNDFMLFTVASGIYFPPQRSKEWSDMKINNVDKEKDNYIDMDTNEFVFNSHKNTTKTGRKVVKFPNKFKSLLNRYLRYNTSDYLIHTKGNLKLSNIQITKHLNDIFGKKVSTSMLRHIYLTEYEKTNPTIAERKKVAADMGHSMNMAMQYVKN